MLEISAIVLAGGQASRLGVDKAFLQLDGEPLVARAVGTLAELTDDIIVVTNDPAAYSHLELPARFVPDERKGVGALMGLYSGLNASAKLYSIVVACDMPFLALPLLRYMVSLTDGYDAVIPRVGDLQEPLHAIYGKRCLPPIERQLSRNRSTIASFFDEVRIRYVEDSEIRRFDRQGRSFLNINTLEDWNRVQQLLELEPEARRDTD